MPTLLEQYEERYANTDFRNRITAAIARRALAVFFESDATPNHANRLIWGKRVLQGRAAEAEAEKFYWPVLLLGTDPTAGDQTIEDTVASIIDHFAQGE